MKLLMFCLLFTALTVPTYAQQTPTPPTETIKTLASHTPEQRELIDLAKDQVGLDG